jgi:hypothetical protein
MIGQYAILTLRGLPLFGEQKRLARKNKTKSGTVDPFESTVPGGSLAFLSGLVTRSRYLGVVVLEL